MKTILAIASGAALGANLRALIIFSSKRFIWSQKFPFDILICNGLGSLLAGMLYVYTQNKDLDESLMFFASIGFLGSLTTFSTFAIDNLKLMQKSSLLMATNILLNVFITLGLAILGGWICRKWIT
tara:strand:- start:74 stop:451 length:378 start_codon:yes stop_codon:yes gene_type:complete